MASFRVANHFISLEIHGTSCPHRKISSPSPIYYSKNENNTPSLQILKSADKTLHRLSKLQKRISLPIQKVHELLVGCEDSKSLGENPEHDSLNPVPHWVDLSNSPEKVVVKKELDGFEKQFKKVTGRTCLTYETRYQTLASLPKETIIIVNSDGKKSIALPNSKRLRPYRGELPAPLHIRTLELYVVFQDSEEKQPQVFWDGDLIPSVPVYTERKECVYCSRGESRRGEHLLYGRGRSKEERREGKRILGRKARSDGVKKHAGEYLKMKRECVRMIRNIERVVELSGRDPWAEESGKGGMMRPISAVPLSTRVMFRKNTSRAGD